MSKDLQRKTNALMPKMMPIWNKSALPDATQYATGHKGEKFVSFLPYIDLIRTYTDFQSLLFVFCDDSGTGFYRNLINSWELNLFLPQGIRFVFGLSIYPDARQRGEFNYWDITSEGVDAHYGGTRFNVQIGAHSQNSGLIEIYGINPLESMMNPVEVLS